MAVVSGPDEVLASAADAGDVPGVVALAADERSVLYEGAFGKRALGKPEAMTLDSVFWIASMTKPVTAVAALQLVERGQLALDEALSERLPRLGTVQVMEGFDAAGKPRLRPPRRPVTLRHLLTHTAGFGYPLWNADLQLWEREAGRSLQEPLVFDPGERWEYGTSTDWVGRVVEQVSGQSLDAYFREHILDPLNMIDTGFVVRPEQVARLVSRHQRHPDGSLQSLGVDVPKPPPAYSGGGGLYGTGPDYVRFLRALLGGGQLDGKRILQPETVAEMARNHIGELTVGGLRSVSPGQSNDLEFYPGMVKKWSLGGLINTQEMATGRSAGSWCWAGLANTYFWIDPTRRITGLILTQILPFRDPTVLGLYDRFETAVYAAHRVA